MVSNYSEHDTVLNLGLTGYVDPKNIVAPAYVPEKQTIYLTAHFSNWTATPI